MYINCGCFSASIAATSDVPSLHYQIAWLGFEPGKFLMGTIYYYSLCSPIISHQTGWIRVSNQG